MPRQTHVAAGILLDSAGRVLVTERTGDHSFAGLWEFPGGKIEDGEESVSALSRELGEELGIEIVDQSLFMQIEHEYPDRSVSIDFYLIRHWRNTPEGRDGQALMWILPEELAEDLLLPADAPVIKALRQR